MSRTLLALSAALLVGGLVMFWVYQDAYRAQETGGELIEVLAAAVDIELGQPVRESWLTTKAIPQSYVENRHLPASAARDLVGFPLAQTVRAGEAILRTDLSTLSDAQRTLSGVIPAGMRAATIQVNATSTFGGLLRPGDRVDVLMSVGSRDFPDTWRGVVVLENLLVLAVGQEFEIRESEDDEQTVRFGRATNITLQVTIEQSGILTIARQRGQMSLLLRNANDAIVAAAHPDLVAADIFDAARRARFLRRYAALARAAPAGSAAPPLSAVP